LIAGALFGLDYKYGWEVTKPWTLPACVAYFLINGAMTYWVSLVESGTIFEGTREGGQKVGAPASGGHPSTVLTVTASQLKLSSHTEKPKPEYVLTILYTNADSTVKWQNNPVAVPFAKLFNTHGFLQRKELAKWLAKEVEVVGHADPMAKAEPLEWDRENGVVPQPSTKPLTPRNGQLEGDVIEVDVVGSGSDEEALSTGRNARARSKSPALDSDGTPVKRGPGRPKKKT
jgi:hypothetical protein